MWLGSTCQLEIYDRVRASTNSPLIDTEITSVLPSTIQASQWEKEDILVPDGGQSYVTQANSCKYT